MIRSEYMNSGLCCQHGFYAVRTSPRRSQNVAKQCAIALKSEVPRDTVSSYNFENWVRTGTQAMSRYPVQYFSNPINHLRIFSGLKYLLRKSRRRTESVLPPTFCLRIATSSVLERYQQVIQAPARSLEGQGTISSRNRLVTLSESMLNRVENSRHPQLIAQSSSMWRRYSRGE